MTTLSPAWQTQHQLGEGVTWDDAVARWRWTDILGRRLHSAAPSDAEPRSVPFDEGVCCYALTRAPGRLLLALESGLADFDEAEGSLRWLEKIDTLDGTLRLNDGRCDRAGHFVFGSMNRKNAEPLGRYYRYSAEGRLDRLDLPQLAISNSTCFSPDGRVMYYADSPAKRIMACDYDAATGAVSNLRVFADLRAEAGEPDGSCIDSEGCLWNARWGGAKVVRFRPDGKVDRVVEAPVDQPSCVAIGGPEMDTLCVTSARVDLSEAALRAKPLAGAVFTLRLDASIGLPESRYAG